MSQYDFGTIDPYVDDGVTLADMLNNWRDAIHSWHRGAGRPSYAVPGMLWINDSAGPTNWMVYAYMGPGAGDVLLWAYDTTTGAFTFGNPAQMASAILLAQAAATPSVRWNATANPADAKAWRATTMADGKLHFGAYTDAGAEIGSGITMTRDGKLIADLSAGTGIAAGCFIGTAPPASPTVGQQWWKSDEGVTYVYYDDGNSTQWVPATAATTTILQAPSLYDKLTLAQPALGGGYTDLTVPMTITQGGQVPWPGGAIKSFTAKNPANPIEVDVTLIHGAGGAAVTIVSALFIDGANNAVQQAIFTCNAQWFGPTRILWRGVLSGGAHTFQVRWGANSGSYLLRNDGTVLTNTGAACTILIREVTN
jgi:hypothetical protein